jgi:hypothetical protein
MMRECHCPLDLPPSRTWTAGRDASVEPPVPQDARPAVDEYGSNATSPHARGSHDPDGSMTRAPQALSAGCARVSSRRPVVDIDRMPLGWAI